jgi:FMN phosphatase YigB (HAD superfamily)
VLQEYDVNPARCVVVEDSRIGVLAAKAAGMRWVLRSAAAQCWKGILGWEVPSAMHAKLLQPPFYGNSLLMPQACGWWAAAT